MTGLKDRLRAAWRGLMGGAVAGGRLVLPSRREAETFEFTYMDFNWRATVSRFDDGGLAEVFLSTAKTGESIKAIANDLAITASLALQHGVSAENLRASLTRNSGGAAASPLSAFLDAYEANKK